MVGDRVFNVATIIQSVMNGIGYIKRITNDATDIEFQHGSVSFETADMLDVQLAYAVSIHKFQALRRCYYFATHKTVGFL